jgi:adenine-specific DNA-methyltransferase
MKNSMDIFGNNACGCGIKTEGIKYNGSKLKIIPHIASMLAQLQDIKVVMDGFSGTTRVSQAFAKMGYKVIANDIAAWSEVFATCYLKAKESDNFYQQIIDHLNNLKGYDGWFTQHYGGDAACGCKRPFQRKNTQKLDAIRSEIDALKLKWEDKCVLLTSLIYAMDAVDSTLGHYSSYLAQWSPRSYGDMKMKLPALCRSPCGHEVVRSDIFEAVQTHAADFAYFDPPYGSNNDKMPPSRVRYASYYHIWTSVVLNDKPHVFGKANRREDTRDSMAASVFEEFRRNEHGNFMAMEALHALLQQTRARYILLSYSSGGRAAKEELFAIIGAAGKLLSAVEIDYKKNVMGGMRWTNDWINSDGAHKEYLFLMEKNT